MRIYYEIKELVTVTKVEYEIDIEDWFIMGFIQ